MIPLYHQSGRGKPKVWKVHDPYFRKLGPMTQNEMSEFLDAGALIRLPSGKVRLWWGPFAPASSGNEQVFSIGWMDFFGPDLCLKRSPKPVLETEASQLRSLLQPFLAGSPFLGSQFLQPSFENFQQSFQEIQGKIYRGEIEKAVPLVFAEAPVVPRREQLAQMLFHALEAHPGLYVFGFWGEGSGILGATPEVLFHLQDKTLQTMALAGTRPSLEGESILRDPKELKEHQLVIDDLKTKLDPLGWVQVGKTQAMSYGSLTHLRTEIQVEVSAASISDLVKRLHPTAALGVYPRAYGYQWMRALPYQDQRGVFGAPVLFSISHTETLALVAIRCLQWSESGSQIGTGCGIIEGSDLQREWAELSLKRAATMKALGLLL